jgi:hypothetical protein
MRIALSALPLLLALGACADSVTDTRYNAASVAYVVPDRAAVSSVEPSATEHCAQFDRVAVMENFTTLEKDAVATFDCRPKDAQE